MGFVYVIGESEAGPVKIGRAGDPSKRLTALQAGNHRRLQILAQRECEQPAFTESRIHDHFRDKRMSGEWFSITATTAADAVAKFCDDGNQPASHQVIVEPFVGDEEALVDRLARFLIDLSESGDVQSKQQEAVA